MLSLYAHRSARKDLSRRAEKALVRKVKTNWLGSRKGLKQIVRRDGGTLRGHLSSFARTVATTLFLLQMYIVDVEAANTTLSIAEGVTNPFGLTQVLVGCTGPAFADMDGDGDQDMLTLDDIGTWYYFENTGGTGISSFGQPVINPFDLPVTEKGRPALADLDGDGNPEIIISGTSGILRIFQSFELEGDILFEELTGELNPFNDFNNLSTGVQEPTFVDIDCDGDLDMVGIDGGGLVYVENSNNGFVEVTGPENVFQGLDILPGDTPSFADVDQDGDLDMILEEADGATRYFENTGSSHDAVFTQRFGAENPFTVLTEDGNSRRVTFVDIDNDGDLDGLSGSDSGDFRFYENTTLQRFGEQIGNPFNFPNVGFASAPTYGDLDGDGDLDSVVGSGNGELRYMEHIGTKTDPSYVERTGTSNPLNGIDVGDISNPTLFDIDGDGDLDVFVGERFGPVFYIENIGTPTNDVFGAPVTGAFNITASVENGSLTFGDINNDGRVDMAAGTGFGDFLFFINTSSSNIPVFADPIENPFHLSNIGDFENKFVLIDINEDGLLDILGSMLSGDFYHNINVGSLEDPLYNKIVTNPSGLTNVGNFPQFGLADFDGDGDKDIGGGLGNGGSFVIFDETTPISISIDDVTINEGFDNEGGGVGAVFFTLTLSEPSDEDISVDFDTFDVTATDGEDYERENLRVTIPAGNTQLQVGVVIYDDDSREDGETFNANLSNPENAILGTKHQGTCTIQDDDGPALIFRDSFAEPGGECDIVVDLRAPDVTGLQCDLIPQIDGIPTDKITFVGPLNTLGNNGYTLSTSIVVLPPSRALTPATTLAANPRVLLFSNTNEKIDLNEDGLRGIFSLIYHIDESVPPGTVIDLVVSNNILSNTGSEAIEHDVIAGQIIVGVKGDLGSGAGPLGAGDGDINVLDIVKQISIILGILPMPESESFAHYVADMNSDGVINVQDIVAMVNAILGPPTAKTTAGAPARNATVHLGAAQAIGDGQLAIPVRLDADGMVAGLEASFIFDPSSMTIGEPYIADRTTHVKLASHTNGGFLRLVAYSLTGEQLPAGEDVTMWIPVTLEENGQGSAVLELADAILADRNAQSVHTILGNSSTTVKSIPVAFSLKPNAPNPFNPSTSIGYEVPRQTHITLTIYNLLGQEVARLMDRVQPAGRHSVVWNARNSYGVPVSSGVYLYRLSTGTGQSESRRMMLLK
jgi:hypothetical protein